METESPVVLSGGDYDVYSAANLERELNALTPGAAVVDLRNVRYLDTISLGIFVKTLKRLRDERPGSTIALVNVNPNIRRVLEITKLTSMFEVE